jgi:20S proteasome alpha/beta subunit
MCNAQRSDPSQFNGGSILAMAGRNSVAIAIDARFGLGMQTITTGDSMTVGGQSPINNNNNNNNNDDDEDDRIVHRTGGEETVGNPRVLLLPNSNTLMAWTGLFGDGMSFGEEINWMLARKVRKAGSMGFPGISIKKRMMSPRAITMLISHLLYRRRNAPYYIETVIVGLESIRVPIVSDYEARSNVESSLGNGESFNETKMTGQEFKAQKLLPFHNERTTSIRDMTAYRTIQKPYLCGTDMLGAKSTSRTFICSGVASKSLHGTAEALWKPDLDGEELVEVCGKAFVSALERDILSGYGAVVYLIQGIRGEDDGKGINYDDEVRIIEYVLACRND